MPGPRSCLNACWNQAGSWNATFPDAPIAKKFIYLSKFEKKVTHKTEKLRTRPFNELGQLPDHVFMHAGTMLDPGMPLKI